MTKTFETFHPDGIPRTEPYAANGRLAYRRYRVTIEVVEDAKGDRERLRELWAEHGCNIHLLPAFRRACTEVGIDMDLLPKPKSRFDP